MTRFSPSSSQNISRRPKKSLNTKHSLTREDRIDATEVIECSAEICNALCSHMSTVSNLQHTTPLPSLPPTHIQFTLLTQLVPCDSKHGLHLQPFHLILNFRRKRFQTYNSCSYKENRLEASFLNLDNLFAIMAKWACKVKSLELVNAAMKNHIVPAQKRDFLWGINTKPSQLSVLLHNAVECPGTAPTRKNSITYCSQIK